MNKPKLTFIEKIEKDITKCNDAAAYCESLIPHLKHAEERELLTKTARDYREDVESLRKLVAKLVEEPSQSHEGEG